MRFFFAKTGLLFERSFGRISRVRISRALAGGILVYIAIKSKSEDSEAFAWADLAMLRRCLCNSTDLTISGLLEMELNGWERPEHVWNTLTMIIRIWNNCSNNVTTTNNDNNGSDAILLSSPPVRIVLLMHSQKNRKKLLLLINDNYQSSHLLRSSKSSFVLGRSA